MNLAARPVTIMPRTTKTDQVCVTLTTRSVKMRMLTGLCVILSCKVTFSVAYLAHAVTMMNTVRGKTREMRTEMGKFKRKNDSERETMTRLAVWLLPTVRKISSAILEAAPAVMALSAA